MALDSFHHFTIVVVVLVTTALSVAVDVSRAGEGQLEIMVNRGSVPNNVRMINKTLFTVSFIPREPIPHTVEIKFNGEPIPRMFLLDESLVISFAIMLSFTS